MKKRYRKVHINIRLFPEEKSILEAKAKGQGVSMSDYLRDAILFGEVRKEEHFFTHEQYKKLRYELNRIGNNVNQIAALSNRKKSTGREAILELRKDYYELEHLYIDTFLQSDNADEEEEEDM